MSFLFVSSNHLQGASEALWTGAAVELARRGHQVTAFTPWSREDPFNPYEKLLAASPVEHRRHAQERKLIAFLLRRVASLRRRLFLKAIRSKRPALVVLSNGDWGDGMELLECIIKSGLPFVTIDHGIFELSWPAADKVERLAASYPKAVRNYFVSQASWQLAQRQLGVELKNAGIVRNPFNVSYDAAPGWPKASDGARLASVARLAPRTKGQDILLQVFDRQKWRSRAKTLTFFGGGTGRKALERVVRMAGLEGVRFAGRVDDVEGIWREHEILVMPSRAENMPLTLVEAMLCGRPAVVTDVGGNAELVEHGVTGFIAESATVAAFDRALEAAWQARPRWPEMGAAAARRIRELMPRHPEKVFADEVERLVTGQRPGS